MARAPRRISLAPPPSVTVASRVLPLRRAAPLVSLPLLTLQLLAPAPLAAQGEGTPAMPQLEARLEAAASPTAGALAGVGLNVRNGWYARTGLGASAGAVRRDGGWVPAQRLALSARFLFDPFGEGRRGFYAGAGLALDRIGDANPRPVLLGIAGVEGRLAGRLVPALEVTVGDGARVGMVLRRRRPQGR